MAREFDSALTQYCEVDSAAVTAYPFSMACWFNANDVATTYTLMCVTVKTSNSYYARLDAAGAVAGDPIRGVLRNTSSYNADTTAGYGAGAWNHGALVFTNATTRAAFLNGGNKGTNASNSAFSASVNRTSVGRYGGLTPSQYFDGLVAWPAVWSVALSDDEIAQLAAGVCPLLVQPQSLVAFWPFDATDLDRVGAFSLTPAGAPTFVDDPGMLYWPRVGVVGMTAGATPPVPAVGVPTILRSQRRLIFPVRPARNLMLATRGRTNYYGEARGKYRVFNDAEYRFYRSNSAPPAEGSTPFATNATLPHTPADVFADGTWYLSVSYFDGVLDSGFLPVGDLGETYLRLDVSGGVALQLPPAAPLDSRVRQTAAGTARITALAIDPTARRGDTWAVAYTTDGTDPAADSPDVTVDFRGTSGVEVLDYSLLGLGVGVTLKVRVQVKRTSDSTYSENSTVLSLAIVEAPTPALGGDTWPGQLPLAAES